MASRRRYDPALSVTFRKTTEAWGGLSNMAGGYPVRVNGIFIFSSEALYQACRFPHLPEVQRLILAERSPMTAKMRSKPHRANSRADWEKVRIEIMKWCIRVKLAHNWTAFGNLLRATKEKPIVEDSRNDEFWGALLQPDGTLEGTNALGRLLMELRVQLLQSPDTLRVVEPPPVENVRLLDSPVERVFARDDRKPLAPQQPDFFRRPQSK